MGSFRNEFNFYTYVYKENGFESIDKEYQKNWMHENYVIDIYSARNMKRKARIVGLTPNGGLELCYIDTKEKVEFNYDEYGIDIDRGCIKHKYANK